MQKILSKRVWRSLKKHIVRYLALGFLIVMGMYLVVSVVGAAETIISRVEQNAEETCLEDGQFSVFVPLSEEEESALLGKGITLEKTFYMDYEMEDKSVLRIFQNREKVNRMTLDEGALPDKKNEIAMEKRYAQEKNIQVGEEITVAGRMFLVTGIGCTPDYDAPLKKLSDSAVHSDGFGTGFVSKDAYEELRQEGKGSKVEEYIYGYLLNGAMSQEALKKELQENTDVLMEEYFDKDVSNLNYFLKAEDNPRIHASADDQVINKIGGMIAGAIALILFTYVISVFVIHGIERESSIIGALYALGAKKKELMIHYLVLPVVVTLVAGCVGTAMGYSPLGINTQMQDSFGYFSIPGMQTVYSGYLLVYGIILPPSIAAIVNCVVIHKRLSQPALQLIRNEQKRGRVFKVNLGNMGFVARFRIRQMLREARAGFTVLFGMFFSLLILMLGVDCYVMCCHISEDNKRDTKFEYMYTYKYPQKEVPEGGEEAFFMEFKKEVMGNKLDVALMGIREDNPYFDLSLPEEADRVVISSAMAEKYKLSQGDILIITDEETNRDYAFTVDGITQYSTSLYAFMDIDSMRELFDVGKEYYNVVFSHEKLDIPSGQLYATTTKEEVFQSADVFTAMMMPMITMMTVVSILIFCVVMYLMMKVMIDRSAFNISLIRIFGYRPGEVKKLYLNGNFYVVAVGAAICIPLSKWVMDTMYPVLVSNVACGMNLTFTWQLYLGIYGAVIIFYLLVNRLLVRRLNKMVPAEVLKNRE